jgi:hypothetical protein
MAEDFDRWTRDGRPSLHLGYGGEFNVWTADGRPLLQLAVASTAAPVEYLAPVIIND